MKIIINKERLVKEVQNVSKAISSKTTVPILTGIKMEVTEQGLTLTGSDADITIKVHIPREEEGSEIVEVIETGGVVLNAKTFGEIVKRMPSTDVEIHAEATSVKIRAKKANFTLNSLNVEHYPIFPKYKEEKVVTIKTQTLKRLINNTSFAVSTSEARPVLTGVNWRLSENKLVCTATDSHRLGKQSAEVVSNIEEDIKVTIPGKYLAEVNKILDESVAETQIIFEDNQVLFKSGNVIVYSRLLEGNYPETDRLIPTESKTDVMICSKELGQAIDRATILNKNHSIVKLTIGENGAELSANTPEIGNVVESLIADSIEGEELTVSFNAKFLMDALKTFEGKPAKLRFTEAFKPFTVTPEDDDSTVHLILPVRTF